MGDLLMCTIWKLLIKGTRAELESILRPHHQQVAVGVKGGLSILIHGMWLLMQQHPDHVFVKIDLRNAFNEDKSFKSSARRCSTQSGRTRSSGRWCPCSMFERTYVHETVAFVGRDKRTLFGREGEGDVSQGGPHVVRNSSRALASVINQ